MPVHVHVKNFQSIEDAEILIDRFTVVTGANNSGKSALLRAIQGVFSNPGGDAYVRHGKDRLSVAIDFGGNQEVTWEKGPKVKPAYKVGGKILHPGRGVPDEVAAMGIQPMSIGAMQVWPQIAPQFTGQVFLLDLPGSAIAEAVADVDRVGQLTQALRLAESDKRSFNAELKVRRKDLQRLQDEEGAYSGIDAVVIAVEAIGRLLSDLDRLSHDLSGLKRIREQHEAVLGTIACTQGVRAISIPAAKQVDVVQAVGTAVQEAVMMRSRLVPARRQTARFSEVRQVLVPPIPKDVQGVQERLTTAKLYRSRLTVVQSVLEQARASSAVVSVVDFPKDGLDGASKVWKALNQIRGMYQRLQSTKITVSQLQNDLELHRESLLLAESDVRNLLDRLGVCPVCARPVTSNLQY